MRKRNKNLLIAWCIFGIFVISFMIETKLYYDSQKEREFSYQYRIIVDENTKKSASSETEEVILSKNNGTNKEKEDKDSRKTESTEPIDDALYEKLACGYVPKISPDGGRAFDAYSVKFKNDINKEKLYLIVLLDADTDQNYLTSIIRRLGKNKITFVVPQYSNHLSETVQSIINAGHEFLLQIPTQTSVPTKKQGIVAPFLANMSAEDLINKLHLLLASSKYAIGLANTTSTLLTKSSNCMSGIAEELSKRGLAFLDLEKSNEIAKKISEVNSDFIYINVPQMFQKNMSSKEISEKKEISVFINDIPAFLSEFSKQKNRILAPISAIIKK
jgi:polysaccharide deacetylase 2 family uncharacterized protein YibQ